MEGGFFRGLERLALACVVCGLAGGSVGLVAEERARPVPVAVLGDSDSESYAGIPERGGPEHVRTLQWTEVLARLRDGEVDLGPWGSWGMPGKVADALRWLGLVSHGRLPRKLDHRYNFANSGAGCSALTEGDSAQAVQLLRLMDRDPALWRAGVVIVRIGVNDFGKQGTLRALSKDPGDPDARHLMDRCVQAIGQTVAAVHARHPATRFVLVGIFNNAHWPKYHHLWRSGTEMRNISSGLDYFDQKLAAMAAHDSRLGFWNDREWFSSRWGGRDPQGQPAYRSLRVGGREVTNTQGDAARHAVIADGHAGLIWNALWAQGMVQFMNQRFSLGLRPIDDAEIVRLLDGLGVPP